ncbi:MAG: MFS transporter [Myxococcales bacterium]|nr:MFS transporter [Myxococcales bacterium]
MAARRALTPLDAYQKKLFVFLSVATFFEGYDFLALSQVLPKLMKEMDLTKGQAGLLVAVINVGTLVAYLLVRAADRWGRRRLLTLTIAGYTLATFATGFAPNVWVFAGLQLVGRVFLIAEWAVSMVYAAEEFPAERRGMVIGVIQAFSSLGSIVCAGVAPLLFQTPYGWRSVYFVGIVPLVILAVARRSLRETKRFAALATARAAVPEVPAERSLFRIWRRGYGKRVLELGLLWSVTYLCTQSAITFWKEFASSERGMDDAQSGLAITVAAVGSMPLVFLSGKLLDKIGRRAGAVCIFGAGALGVFLCYTLEGQWPLTVALAFGIFGTSGVLPVLNAFTAERFPTELRGDAFAWANNLLGRVGYIASPLLIGVVAESIGWGHTMQLASLALVVALGLIFLMLPETRGKELEETSRL